MQIDFIARSQRTMLAVGRLGIVAFAASLALAIPTTKPNAKPARQTAEILSAQGLVALAAKDSRASLDAFLDAQQVLKADKSITPIDPLRLQTNHGLAVAYMLANKYDKAGEFFKPGEPLDKFAATPAVTRDVVYNRAVLDFKQRVNLMRSVKAMKDYMTAHPENDQPMLDLLGTMLDRAARDERFSKATLFTQAGTFYMAAAEKLEAANPGQRRWGVDWISLKDYEARTKDRGKLVEDYDDAMSDLNEAISEARSAEQYFNAERGKAAMRRANNMAEASRRKQRADAKVSERQKLADEKRALIPGYPWLADVGPVIPGETAPPVVVIAVPKPPIAEEHHHPTHVQKPVKIDEPAEPANPPENPPPAEPHQPAEADPPAEPIPAQPPVQEKETRKHVTRYAAAFPIASDLLITSAAAVDHAESISLEDSQGNTFNAQLVRADDKTGLALIRVAGQKFAYINPGEAFAGGDVRCVGFPSVAIFSPTPEVLTGRAGKPAATGNWIASFTVNPRLPGAPLITADGKLVGVVMADRDLPPSQTPVIRCDDLKAFLADDAPKQTCATKLDPPFVLMMTAQISK